MPNQIVSGAPLSLVVAHGAVSKLHQNGAISDESQSATRKFTFLRCRKQLVGFLWKARRSGVWAYAGVMKTEPEVRALDLQQINLSADSIGAIDINR
jgi:hypothetical protein